MLEEDSAPWRDLTLENPIRAIREISHDVTGRKKVRLTYGVISVPKTRGVFEQTLKAQGIDVEWVGPFPNHAPTLQAVATDTADFSFGGSSTPADQALLSGNKLKYVAWATAKPRLSSILALPASGITSVRDLAGRTVAVNKAGLGEFLLVAALEKYGVPRESVTFTYLNPPDAAPAFGSGKVDAWSIWSGPMELAEVQYGAKRIFTDGEELDRQIDFSTYLVREDYAKKEADTIRKVIAAYKAEADWVNANQAEAQKTLQRQRRLAQDLELRDSLAKKIDDIGVLIEWAQGGEDVTGARAMPRPRPGP